MYIFTFADTNVNTYICTYESIQIRTYIHCSMYKYYIINEKGEERAQSATLHTCFQLPPTHTYYTYVCTYVCTQKVRGKKDTVSRVMRRSK